MYIHTCHVLCELTVGIYRKKDTQRHPSHTTAAPLPLPSSLCPIGKGEHVSFTNPFHKILKIKNHRIAVCVVHAKIATFVLDGTGGTGGQRHLFCNTNILLVRFAPPAGRFEMPEDAHDTMNWFSPKSYLPLEDPSAIWSRKHHGV